MRQGQCIRVQFYVQALQYLSQHSAYLRMRCRHQKSTRQQKQRTAGYRTKSPLERRTKHPVSVREQILGGISPSFTYARGVSRGNDEDRSEHLYSPKHTVRSIIIRKYEQATPALLDRASIIIIIPDGVIRFARTPHISIESIRLFRNICLDPWGSSTREQLTAENCISRKECTFVCFRIMVEPLSNVPASLSITTLHSNARASLRKHNYILSNLPASPALWTCCRCLRLR